MSATKPLSEPLTGVLFPLTRYATDDHDMAGEVRVGGVTYKVLAWRKSGVRGEYLMLRLSPDVDRGVDRTAREVG